MSLLAATVEGIGFWSRGLPSWDAARAHAAGVDPPAGAPARPAPQLLAPNERRRAPETVAAALEVGLAACRAAGRDPGTLPSVFASMHGELAINDYMCTTLAQQPEALSPTRFHNSVHNAAAGYWTIGTGAMHPATALSAGRHSFAQGLLEALAQLAAGSEAVLLVAGDGEATGPLAQVARSEGVLAAVLVLAAAPRPGRPKLRVDWGTGTPTAGGGPLSRHAAGNAMAPMLPLLDALARGRDAVMLAAGPGRVLQVAIDHQAA